MMPILLKLVQKKNLGDVLKRRLPGVEVNADGEIEVEGKESWKSTW